jgi:hypothetical protein
VPVASLSTPRQDQGTPAELPDGKILIAGGTGSTGVTYTAETYTPCPLNLRPVAVCQNVTVPVDAATCTVSATPVTAAMVNNGSYDPDNGPVAPLTLSLSPAGPYPLGTTTVTLTANDGELDGTCTAQVSVVDTTPPAPGVSRGMVLWPADGALHEITLMDCADFATDVCSGRLIPLKDYGIITHVTSDEPDNDPASNADGNTTGDVQIKKPWLALVRAERDTRRNGRVYTLHYIPHDPSGNWNFANPGSCTVSVPLNQGTPAVNDTVKYCVDNSQDPPTTPPSPPKNYCLP